jgi:crotonobetainyl-CoA:carnitine CoA-transferase CaiB-like acyl-CoA transferase
VTKLPLDGIRVGDFSWFGAGPIAGQTLATFGAEVIRIESEAKMDGLRLGHPFAMNEDGTFKTGYNVSGYYNNCNAGKLSMQLNLNTERGQEVAYRLLEKCDLFLTNFTPRVVAKWNLGWEQLHNLNPRLIAAYEPMQGLEGPHRDFLGFGAVLTPITGFTALSGFPERGPIGVGTNYPDYVINPGHTVVAMLAALRYRNRTGKGQLVEVPQMESVVNVLGTAVANYLATGEIETQTGNRSPIMSPHGAFRCADDPESVGSEDRWVVIALRDDALWQAVVDAIGDGQADPKFATFEGRKGHEDELEALISSWTRDRKAEHVMEALQSRGVPCGVVQNAQDMLDRDQHMQARGYYRRLDHPETGIAAYDGPAMVLSETPGPLDRPAPLFGNDTLEVCERIIGLSQDEVADLLAEGVLV